jgi:hypothetical protein
LIELECRDQLVGHLTINCRFLPGTHRIPQHPRKTRRATATPIQMHELVRERDRARNLVKISGQQNHCMPITFPASTMHTLR